MVIKGLDELRETLKKFKDKYVKLNTFRGDIESFPDKDFKYVEPLLNKLAVKLGPFAEDIDFIVEDRIKGIEPGIDAILYKGKVVSPTMAGFEVKGAGYIAKVMNYEEVPEPLKLVSDKLEPILKKMDYNFFFSSEVMCTLKGEGYMIDFCCRMAAPVPSAIQTELIENYSEIIWGMGHGEKVIPKYTAKFGGGAAFYSSWAEMGDWLNVSIDKKDRQWIKFREAVKYGKEYYAVPGASTVCTVIAIGDSVEEVMLKVKERAESVKAYQLDKSSEDFVELKEILEEAKDYGFIF
jgi:phosphoribosylamine-glycine ligase